MNTLQFAEYELKRYCAEMGISPEITLATDEKQFDKTHFRQFDAELDDAFSVSVKAGKGTIVGTNCRAVLLGVYHFLKMQGCRFMRPGKDGEHVPCVEKIKDGEETWYANCRHRGATDAGCNGGIDGMLAFIDWLPKAMFNTYFIEMTDFYSDMQAWYAYDDHPFKKEYAVSRAQFDTWHGWIVEELQKRSLIRHGAGHGWTNMLMEGIGETRRTAEIRRTNEWPVCKNTDILAEINGERALFNGIPFNTNLCLSNDKVRADFVGHVCAYAAQHPEIDYLHIWLADAFSNFCECDACRKLTPTDWYVKLLNDIDAALTAQGLKQKLVFLVYFELLYPPKTERIQNEDRFTLLFCPYGRDFTKRYSEWEELPYEPAPLNQFKRSDMHMGMYLSQLRQWKKIFKGECIVFDYNLFDSASYVDITNLLQAPIVTDDCLYYKKIGISGRIECGNTRFMMPTSYVWCSMAEALFYGKPYDEEQFFEDMFGKDEPVRAFLNELKDVLPTAYMLCRRTTFTKAEEKGITEGLTKIKDFRTCLFAYTPKEDFYRKNVEYFLEYLDFLEIIFIAMIDKINGATAEKMEEYAEELRMASYRKQDVMPLYMPGGWYAHICNAFRNRYEREEF